MNDERTKHQPIEPTIPVPPPGSPYTNPYASSNVDGPIGIPPPPPSLLPPPLPEKPRRSVLVLGIVLAIALLLFASAGLYALARSYQMSTEQPTPTARPYTAQDILNEIIAHHLTANGPIYAASLRYFLYDPIYDNAVAVPFQSSVIWSVYSGQSPAANSCPDACVGLWVYNSYDDATTVEKRLIADGYLARQTPTQGPTPYPILSHYGRCVAQGVQNSPYVTVIEQYCV
ncbi:MAG TPA: hypothetical protein VEU97_05670 [Ktedonobacteraceae bacterium]|nr:hypothetical protein [Ktedonobacteraceae bacterium]